MTEAVCKTVHTEHLAAFGRVHYKSKQGMEALYTPIIPISHRVSLICSFQVQIWRYDVLISSLNISAQGPFFPTAETFLILIPYHHPLALSVIFSAQGGIVYLAPHRLSNKSYCKTAQQTPWAECTLGGGSVWSWTSRRL